ncbi:hypothetical protein BNJ_00264 [Kaumoebavirus]|uniref:hypothetical protein n=1 Tax=Kaumoebavirus TaxID=1859492 RepID=UPI0009C2B15D|nr:hypothetical protein BNJ_00264 [Kaumoebavirus]ARA72089.1 hypothetical protein BNJ_00264 [Kaumoebavirus]
MDITKLYIDLSSQFRQISQQYQGTSQYLIEAQKFVDTLKTPRKTKEPWIRSNFPWGIAPRYEIEDDDDVSESEEEPVPVKRDLSSYIV